MSLSGLSVEVNHVSPALNALHAQQSSRFFFSRGSRITRSQKRALAELLPRYGLLGESPICPREVFFRSAPLVAEIGCGDGRVLLECACRHPENDYLAVEMDPSSVGKLLMGIAQANLDNVRVMHIDAAEAFRTRIPRQSLAEIFIFFPDPWHKRRHRKRRLIQQEMCHVWAAVLRPGGRLLFASDCEDYVEQALLAFECSGAFVNLAGKSNCAPRPRWRKITKYEKRGLQLGHAIRDLCFMRAPDFEENSVRQDSLLKQQDSWLAGSLG
ncbi:MAG: tRNA (guanosine(46)-N7)-methyltransferase TrmB [Candidatus Eutrophobiaceae bacterium]